MCPRGKCLPCSSSYVPRTTAKTCRTSRCTQMLRRQPRRTKKPSSASSAHWKRWATAAGSANPKRKIISLSLMHNETPCACVGVRVHRRVHGCLRPSFTTFFLKWNPECTAVSPVGLAAFSLCSCYSETLPFLFLEHA